MTRIFTAQGQEKTGTAARYASIYVSDGATAQSGISTTPAKVTGFAANGPNNDAVPDHTNDQITINTAGVYKLAFQCSFSGTVSTKFTFKLRVNAVEQNLGCIRTLGTGGDSGSCSFVGLQTLSASDVLTIYVEADGASKSITPSDMSLSIFEVAAITDSGTGSDSDAIHDNVSGEIAAVTEKVSPVGADVLLIEDSAAANAKKRVQITNLPAGTPADNSITNAKLSDINQNEIKGRATAGAGDPEDLTAAQVRTIINVEDGSTADQTGAEIKTAYEGENFAANTMLGNNTGAPAGPVELTTTQVRTLLNVEDGSTADQTGAEIKTAYEGENFKAYSLLGNNTGSAAGPTEIDASNVAEDATPSSGNKLLGFQSGAVGATLQVFDIGNLPAGSEVNDLATDGISGIADDQIAVGSGAGTAAYKTLPNGAVAYNTGSNTLAQASSTDLLDGTSVLLTTNTKTVSNKDMTAATNSHRHTKNITIESPTSSEDITWFFTDRAITVVQVRAVLANGSATPTVTYQVFHATDRSAAGTGVTTSGAVTSITTGTDATLSDTTIPANSYVWIETTAQGGTTPEIQLFMEFTDD